jgi:hypothetical protein
VLAVCPATDDRDGPEGTQSETGVVPAIAGYSDAARGIRLRLRFDDRELLLDVHHASITLGRAEDNDVLLKGHLISRLHARIEIGRRNFVLVDQSTNGTFVQTGDGEELFIRRDILR